MANIFTLENVQDFSEKINMDELYEKKKQYDLNKLELFNKILNRIHVRIKMTAKQKLEEHFCWFIVPEIIIGVPKYDQGACIAYLLDKLKENGFNVRYTHPNALFICWQHFVPSYVRNEFKKKTGIVIDEYGRKVLSEEEKNQTMDIFSQQTQQKTSTPTPTLSKKHQNNKKFTPIHSYKPNGLVYNDTMLNSLEDKFS
jgi:Family of unknown function (DUF5759)